VRATESEQIHVAVQNPQAQAALRLLRRRTRQAGIPDVFVLLENTVSQMAKASATTKSFRCQRWRIGGNTMRTATQKSVQEDLFIRMLGRVPLTRRPKVSITDRFDLFTETFGPPERSLQKKHMLLVWNFIRIDQNGNRLFSLSSRIPSGTHLTRASEIEVRVVADSGIERFSDWTFERLGDVGNGEELPHFVGTRPYAITPL
jgi:hypothetical protein